MVSCCRFCSLKAGRAGIVRLLRIVASLEHQSSDHAFVRWQWQYMRSHMQRTKSGQFVLSQENDKIDTRHEKGQLKALTSARSSPMSEQPPSENSRGLIRSCCHVAGKQTVHELLGTRVAVLAGDFLFAQSSWYLANLDNLEVIKLISQVSIHTLESVFLTFPANVPFSGASESGTGCSPGARKSGSGSFGCREATDAAEDGDRYCGDEHGLVAVYKEVLASASRYMRC